jgi:acetoin utilization deacetylase AcuC-like enzyme
VELVYGPGYLLPASGLPQDPERGEHVLTFLAAEGLIAERRVHRAQPASLKTLARVHTADYLDSLHRPETLVKIVGFRLPDPLHDRLLDLERAMTGGTLLATALALRTGGTAVNLGGGFHHAFADHGERFCLFNDVAVAVAEQRRQGFDEPVLVIDLDLHDGDGTRRIFAADPSVHTFSIHNQTNGTAEAVAATVVELGSAVGDDAYLEAVRERLPAVFEQVDPGLVFYLAGTDPAYDDTIGDWRITPRGLLERDLLVARLTGALAGEDGRRRPRRPLVVLLAGGYGRNSWRYTARFLARLLGSESAEPPSTEEITLARYRRVARRFEPSELTREAGDDWGLTEADVLGSLAGMRPRSRLLGYYSKHGVELALERSGLLDKLRALGFERPRLDFDLDNPAGETVRIFGGPDRSELLMELRVRKDLATVPGLELLRAEWLLLQNPRLDFPPGRVPLPGQSHPGLGLLRDVVSLLVLVCDRIGLDGLLFVPAHYHMGAQSRKLLRFLEPTHEARFRALRQALGGLGLVAATRAVAEGRVIDETTGHPFEWEPVPMVLPVSDELKRRLLGVGYEAAVERAAGRYQYRLLDSAPEGPSLA